MKTATHHVKSLEKELAQKSRLLEKILGLLKGKKRKARKTRKSTEAAAPKPRKARTPKAAPVETPA